jgi:hypothetical protein
MTRTLSQFVMPALAAGIHATCDSPIAWMPGSSPGMTEEWDVQA